MRSRILSIKDHEQIFHDMPKWAKYAVVCGEDNIIIQYTRTLRGAKRVYDKLDMVLKGGNDD